jgi:GLPGLI family protein
MIYKKLLLPFVFFVLLMNNTKAQDFITRAKIEFEKKVNMHRNIQGDNADKIKESIPKYDVTYYNFTYAGGQSLYKYDRENAAGQNPNFRITHDENSLFIDYTTKQTVAKKSIFLEDYIVKDTIKAIKWKITQETRNIAGYECRKAIGRIYDSVYIIAFYCEQMVMKAGPEGIQGLPGMILGMAIPTINTTWFASKIELANIDEATIVPPNKGKKLSDKELTDMMIKRYKEYGMKDIKPETVQRSFKNYLL